MGHATVPISTISRPQLVIIIFKMSLTCRSNSLSHASAGSQTHTRDRQVTTFDIPLFITT